MYDLCHRWRNYHGLCSAVLGYVNTSQEADIRNFAAWWGTQHFVWTVKILILKKLQNLYSLIWGGRTKWINKRYWCLFPSFVIQTFNKQRNKAIRNVERWGFPLDKMYCVCLFIECRRYNLLLKILWLIWKCNIGLLKTSKYFKQLIFNTLLFADDQFIISDTENNLQKAVYLLYNISEEYNLEISTKKTKVFGSVGTDHLKKKLL